MTEPDFQEFHAHPSVWPQYITNKIKETSELEHCRPAWWAL